jgi:excisionase family DNA binding protein
VSRVSAELKLALSSELVELIAERAAELVRQGEPREDPSSQPNSGAWGCSPYLSVSEAAEYLRAKPQRIYDLLSSRRLTRHKDGTRVLISRAELDAHLVRSGRSQVAPVLPPVQERRLLSGFAK